MIDKDFLAERRSSPHQDQQRNPFLRDRGRIVHSAFFRRLQTKKQILDYYANDFSRTRLTHSLEVAQISLGICETLKEKYPNQKTIFPANFCIESIALAHDLGHPPNGHAGEIALHNCMKESGGFEGNAQTFRIIGRLGEGEIHQENKKPLGLNLTRATMLGVLKYPIFYSQYQKNQSLNIPPKCIFDEEKEILHWVLEPFEKDIPKIEQLQIAVGKGEQKREILLNLFSSIMDLADDISYGIHDFEDGVTLGLLSKESIQKDFPDFEQIYKEATSQSDINWNDFCTNIFCDSEKKRKRMISKIVHFLISNCRLKQKNEFYFPLLDYSVCLPENFSQLLKKFQQIVQKQIIQKRENLIIDFQLQNIIKKVFNCFKENSELLPKKYQKNENVPKDRVLCDYLAGMTDKYLVKIYQALFIPETTSIFDRL